MTKSHHIVGVAGIALVAAFFTFVIQPSRTEVPGNSMAAQAWVWAPQNTLVRGIQFIGDGNLRQIPALTPVIFLCHPSQEAQLPLLMNPFVMVAMYEFSGFEAQRGFLTGMFRLDGKYGYTPRMYQMNRMLAVTTIQRFNPARWYAVIANVPLVVSCQRGLWDPMMAPNGF